MNIFSVDNIAFSLLGYPMSWVELMATLFTVACVWLAIIKHILNWPVAIVAIILSFLLFYQNALYADCFLQIYFLFTSIYGWWYWSKKESGLPQMDITLLSTKQRIVWVTTILILTLITSYIMQHLNSWVPFLFPVPAAFPIPDSFIMVTSISGQWLLARKKPENWFCWIAVNTTATVVYLLKNIKLFSLLYFILLIMAILGSINWTKEALYQTDRKV